MIDELQIPICVVLGESMVGNAQRNTIVTQISEMGHDKLPKSR